MTSPRPGLLEWLVGLFAAGCIASLIFLQMVHFNDLFNMQGIEAIRTVQAKYMNVGEWFPPLRQDGYFGGSRYMPLPIALHASAALLTGEYLHSGKIVGYAIGALALVTVFILCIKSGVPHLLALGLVGCSVATTVALQSFTGLGADALPALFQIAALALIANRRRDVDASMAGVLCGLAFLAKLAGIWGGVTIVFWLLWRERRLLKFFLPAWLAVGVVGFAAMNLASDDALLDSLRLLAFSGTDLSLAGLDLGLARTVGTIVDHATSMAVLLPLALATWSLRRSPSIFGLGLLIHLAFLIVVMADPGAAENHGIDIVLLTPLVVGAALFSIRGEDSSPATGPLSRSGVATFLLVALLFGFVLNVRPVVADAFASLGGEHSTAFDPVVLRGDVFAYDSILAENPYVPFSRGQRPVVLDPFLFRRMTLVQPEWGKALAQRIREQEFTKVVLGHDLSDTFWYTRYQFGPDVLESIRSSYRLTVVRDGYYIYEPTTQAPEGT
jgi:hypothetical protein